MKQLFDFHCKHCDDVFERFIDSDIREVECECGEIAVRLIAAPRVVLDGTDPGFPGAYDKWARIREDNARIKARKQS